jgi:signal transduction histidine kinase
VSEHLGTILNVNDHEQTRYMVSRMLRLSGYDVKEAATGEEALRLAGTNPDLIVLDVKLPDISGFDVCRMLKSRAETSAISILQTSATFVTTQKRVEGLDSGADAYLTHPFEQAELVATVKALMRLRRAEQELRRRAESLETADRRKDEFLAMLAHELRNPLSAIAVAIPLVDRVSIDPRAKRLCGVMARQSEHLARLVDDLLDVARITQGKISLRRRPIAIAAALQHAIQSNSGGVSRKGQAVVVSAPSDVLFVDADESRLEQILSNLIENASKYSDEGMQIEITVAAAARDGRDDVVVRVRDSGVGISADMLPHVFDLFVQADDSLARARGGMGIGLTLVKRLVDLHGGQVFASSEGLGRGSTFEVSLPKAAAPAATDGEDGQQSSGASRRILLVEDNDDARETLRIVLEEYGHRVDEASDGRAGVELALSGAYDVAIVDVGLPVLDGYQVATRVRSEARARRLPMIALTGYGGEDPRARALRAGFDAHLVKPVTGEGVLELVESLLGSAEDCRRTA